MLAVAQISFFRDPQGRAPEQLLRDWPTLSTVADAAALAGARVAVIQACGQTRLLQRGVVDYHFLPCDREPGLLRPLLASLRPQVLHVHGLGFPREVLGLATLAPDCPLVLQDHADRPPRWPWRWPLWRRSLAAVQGLMFCAREQAEPFRHRRLLPAGLPVFEVPESSCRFQPGDATSARQATGLAGDPALLWVGHLNANKDPLTVLDGVALASERLPGLQLWCCFGQAPLREVVQARIDSDPRLQGRVQLLGAVPHAQIERLMAAADFLVQGSHQEGSGYSVIEALACGLPPVVTDIPSFRALLAGGTAGALWPTGQPAALAEALWLLHAVPAAQRRAAARACFESQVSLEAVGRQLMAVYAALRDAGAARRAPERMAC